MGAHEPQEVRTVERAKLYAEQVWRDDVEPHLGIVQRFAIKARVVNIVARAWLVGWAARSEHDQRRGRR